MTRPVGPGDPVATGGGGRRVVALGGGHGLHASLSALGRLVDDGRVADLTAIVTVADNGGSSGRLRGEFGVPAPGDLRMALSAVARDDDWGDTWTRLVQHRFAGDGEMRGHVVGNLLIVALWELLGDPIAALDWIGRLLGARGRVLPMAQVPMDITAEVRGLVDDDPEALTTVRGQVQVARTGGVITSLDVVPPDPEVSPIVLSQVADADWVLIGPGSWFSSVLPHVRVPALRRALVETDARLVVVLNLEEQDGETGGFAPSDHLAVLVEHAPDLHVHTVLADRANVTVEHADDLRAVVEAMGARLVLDDVACDDGTPRHDHAKLAAAYARIMAVD